MATLYITKIFFDFVSQNKTSALATLFQTIGIERISLKHPQ